MAEWNQANIDLLRALWCDEHAGGAPVYSTRQIAEILGFTKNGVVGKAHRLNLPARESPIGNHSARPVAPRRPRRAKAVTLPPIASIQPVPAVVPVPAATQKPAPVFQEPIRPAIAAEPIDSTPRACDTPPAFLYAEGGWGCQFIKKWNDARPSLSLFCGQPRSEVGSAWCWKCREIVYTRLAPRQPLPGYRSALNGGAWT